MDQILILRNLRVLPTLCGSPVSKNEEKMTIFLTITVYEYFHKILGSLFKNQMVLLLDSYTHVILNDFLYFLSCK